MWFSQLEKVIQSQELADALRGASASNQSILAVVHQQQLVDVVGLGQVMRAGLDTRRRVALLVVHYGTGHVTPQFGQVAWQLVDPVNSTNVYLASGVMNGKVSQAPFWWREGLEGLCGPSSAINGEGEGHQAKKEHWPSAGGTMRPRLMPHIGSGPRRGRFDGSSFYDNLSLSGTVLYIFNLQKWAESLIDPLLSS